MKQFKFFILFLCCYFQIFSQNNENKSNIGCHPKGTFVLDAYYGAPNLSNSFFRLWIFAINATYEDAITNVHYKSFGPVGLRAEYFILRNLGVGLDLNYSTSSVSLTYKHHDETLLDYLPENYTFSLPRIGIIPRVNWHFIGKSKVVDGYLVLGMGYRNYTVGVSTTDYFKRLKFDYNVPVFAFRLGCGFRFFVNENLGFNVETGIGGALITAGMSVKFQTNKNRNP